MEPLSVDKFLAARNISAGSIQINKISDLPQKSKTSSEDYLRLRGIETDGVAIADEKTVTLQFRLFGFAKGRQPKVRSGRSSKTQITNAWRSRHSEQLSDQKRSWIWIAVSIVIGQIWFATLLTLPAKAQCQDEMSQNWLQFSLELITESLKL